MSVSHPSMARTPRASMAHRAFTATDPPRRTRWPVSGFRQKSLKSTTAGSRPTAHEENTVGPMQDGNETGCPLLRDKDHTQPSVFRPEHLLREARRQKGLVDRDVPAVCVLDLDGDLFRHARLSGLARLASARAGPATTQSCSSCRCRTGPSSESSAMPSAHLSRCWSPSSCSRPAAAS